MSRRHTPTANTHRLSRVLGIALILLVALAASLPAAVAAQKGDQINDSDIQWSWQLLTYRDADGDVKPVPAGVGATLSLFSNSAFGDAACSSYESSYTWQDPSLFLDDPQVTQFECDPSSKAFDDVFYQKLAETRSISLSNSIMTLNDLIGEPLMTLTRAKVEDDPTVARWDLARMADADGAIEPVIQGLDPWIEFLRGGRLVGSTGCGSFLGSYSINDGTMAITDVSYRLDTCTESVQQQARRILATLDEITDFQVRPAGLSLEDTDGTTRLALTPDLDLGRHTWTPIAVYAEDGEEAWGAKELSTSAVKFSDDDSAAGGSACRAFEADSLRLGLALSVSGITMDGPRCGKAANKSNPDLLKDIEKSFIQALKAASSHALRGSELELKDVEGRTLMRLLPQAELVGPSWVVKWMDHTPKRTKTSKKRPLKGTVITAEFEDLGVVLGETGAADSTGANFYKARYRTPKATRIEIEDFETSGFACRGKKKAAKPACVQQGRFKSLMESADRYVVKDDELRLLKGSRVIIAFKPEILDSGAN